jgi:hypothetical protein
METCVFGYITQSRYLSMSGLCIYLAVKLAVDSFHYVVQRTVNSGIQAEETLLLTKTDNVRFSNSG